MSLRAKALWALGALAVLADDYGAAIRAGKESLALYQELGDSGGMARALQVVGACTLFEDPAKGRPLFRESVAMARQAGWRNIHSMAIEPDPAPTSHNNWPGTGASTESVTARVSRFVN